VSAGVWRVVFAPSAAEAVRGLPPDVKRSVREAIRVITADPYTGKAVLRDLKGLRTYRARRYRIVYELAVAARQVRVVAVAHRSSVYEELARRRMTERARK
jgi:mRNA interferase RelE/StbE